MGFSGSSLPTEAGFAVFELTQISYSLVRKFDSASVPGFNTSDAGFGRRVATLGGPGGRCGRSGVRASATPTGNCSLVVSAFGGTRGGSLYAMQSMWLDGGVCAGCGGCGGVCGGWGVA